MTPIGIILISHDKPRLLRQALDSVLAQTFTDWHCILWDSGVLSSAGFFDDVDDPRLDLLLTHEEPGANQVRNMASWCVNETFARGLWRSDLILHLCDDDVLYPETFSGFVQVRRAHPLVRAMYGSQDVMHVDSAGRAFLASERLARLVAGRHFGGVALDCRVDYMQVCHAAELLPEFSQRFGTERYYSEDKKDAWHCEGIYFEKLAELTPIIPVPVRVGQNRRTPASVNIPMAQPNARGGKLIRPEDMEVLPESCNLLGTAQSRAALDQWLDYLRRQPGHERVALTECVDTIRWDTPCVRFVIENLPRTK